MVSSDVVKGLRQQLAAANKAMNAQTCVNILMRLEHEVEPTHELLKETKIGHTVNNIKEHACTRDVGTLAASLVAKWKAAVASSAGNGVAKSPPLPPSPVSPTDSTFPSTSRTSSSSSVTKGKGRLLAPTPVSPPGGGPSPRLKVVTRPAASAATKRPRPPSASPSPDSDESLPPPPTKVPKRAEPARTHKTDQIVVKSAFVKEPGSDKAVDKQRMACCEALYDALACDSTAVKDDLLHKAVDLELCVWTKCPPDQDDDRFVIGTSQAYKAKLRSLVANLKRPQHNTYRERLVSGELEVGVVVDMSSEDFCSDEQKALNEKARQTSLQSAQISSSSVAEDLREKAMWRPGGR